MNQKISPNYIEDVVLQPYATIEMASPFTSVDVGFLWLNRDYDIYHSHSHWEILVVVSGEILHTINDQEYLMKRGDCCLIRPDDMHSLRFPTDRKEKIEPHQHLDFFFKGEFAERLIGLFGDYDTLLASKEPLKFTIEDLYLNTIYYKAVLTQNFPREDYVVSTNLMISQILNIFWEQRIFHNPDYPDWLNDFLTYISHPNNFGKSVNELSKSTAYSYSRLARLFKEYVGTTLVDYINEKKMTHAKRLLRTTTLPMIQISEQIGYNSLSSFNHLFKNTYGLTPSEYRKKEGKRQEHAHL